MASETFARLMATVPRRFLGAGEPDRGVATPTTAIAHQQIVYILISAILFA